MDAGRFDALARFFALGPRRRFVRTLSGVALSSLPPLLAVGEAGAKKGGGKKGGGGNGDGKKKKKGCGGKKKCGAGQECCFGKRCCAAGRCADSGFCSECPDPIDSCYYTVCDNNGLVKTLPKCNPNEVCEAGQCVKKCTGTPPTCPPCHEPRCVAPGSWFNEYICEFTCMGKQETCHDGACVICKSDETPCYRSAIDYYECCKDTAKETCTPCGCCLDGQICCESTGTCLYPVSCPS
jgi:hypothetical protein